MLQLKQHGPVISLIGFYELRDIACVCYRTEFEVSCVQHAAPALVQFLKNQLDRVAVFLREQYKVNLQKRRFIEMNLYQRSEYHAK
jgi:hypothetical protein